MTTGPPTVIPGGLLSLPGSWVVGQDTVVDVDTEIDRDPSVCLYKVPLSRSCFLFPAYTHSTVGWHLFLKHLGGSRDREVGLEGQNRKVQGVLVRGGEVGKRGTDVCGWTSTGSGRE